MKILEALTYYRPHISGLNIYVERLCRALARQGHEVTVLTSQYDPSLPRQEMLDGVRIIRVPVSLRISKGVIMPTIGLWATRLAWQADVIHLHLPQFDAPGIALRGQIFGKPVVLTYHSDLQLPPGPFNRLVDQVVVLMNRLSGSLSDAVVTYTRDFGSHSPFLSRYLGDKLQVIPPPVELAPATPDEVASFHAQYDLAGKRVIGISARVAAEKGIEVLLHALPKILVSCANATILHADPEAVGEEAYAARLAPLFTKYDSHYRRIGTLHGSKLTAFYKNLDCLVLCSLNNTETFGLVQVEAMINGVPCVATNLPGVRRPVQLTGMGEIVPIGDSDALAAAITRVLNNKEAYVKDPALISQSFDPDTTANAYIELFNHLRQGKQVRGTPEPAAYERLRAMNNVQ